MTLHGILRIGTRPTSNCDAFWGIAEWTMGSKATAAIEWLSSGGKIGLTFAPMLRYKKRADFGSRFSVCVELPKQPFAS